ncbi:MAG: hypothetical protein P8I44_03890 [Phycisphaerales bacterium]|nr:hypothetical protein [Phycisphaerales bacterium]
MLYFDVESPDPASNGPGDTRSSSAAITLVFAFGEFELLTLDTLDLEDLTVLVSQGEAHAPKITGQPSHAVRFQRCGMVGAFPRPVEREVPFHPSGAEGHGGHVSRDAKVMSGETDRLDSTFELLLEPRDFQEADVLESDRIPGGATVDDEISNAILRFEELDDLVLFFMGGHTEGEVYFAVVVQAEVIQHFPMQVAGGGDLDERWIQGGDFPGRCGVPDGAAVFNAQFDAPTLNLAMLVDVEFQELAMDAVGLAVGVHEIGMGGRRIPPS